LELMKNPVFAVREEKNLSVTDLAMMAGVGALRIRQIEKGEPYTLNGKVLDALVELGYSRTSLISSYGDWRKKLASLKKAGIKS